MRHAESLRRAVRKRPRAAAATLVAVFAVSAPLAAQNGDPASDLSGPGDAPRLSNLPDAEGATLGMKLERTILGIDVLALTVRFDSATARAISKITADVEEPDDELERRLAELAIAPERAVARIEFLRGVSLDQFLGGITDDMGQAVEAGWIEPRTFEMLGDSLPPWFGFLEKRRIREGDLLLYGIRGDTLRTVFWGLDEGQILLDQTDVGREHALALLGAYFAPGSSFREDLIESLWEGWDPADP